MKMTLRFLLLVTIILIFQACQKDIDEHTGSNPINNNFDCSDYVLSLGLYPETVDLNDAVEFELSSSYKLIDWYDLKSISNIQGWIQCMKFSDDQSFYVMKNGDRYYSGTRHYYVHYFADKKPYQNFLIHDQIGGNLLCLGSWYDLDMNFLAIVGEVPPTVNCYGLDITINTYSESENLEQAIVSEFGQDFVIADWNDLQALANINNWISCMDFEEDDSFILTSNGEYIWSDNRQYFATYSSDGLPHSGFLAHDQLGGLYLGSWYGLNKRILVKNLSK